MFCIVESLTQTTFLSANSRSAAVAVTVAEGAAVGETVAHLLRTKQRKNKV